MPAEQPDRAENDLECFALHRRPALLAIARSIVGDSHEAEDVVQDTLAAALPRLAQIDPDKHEAYLREAVRRNALKRKVRRREHPAPPEMLESMPTAKRHETLDALELEEAIESLPLLQQTALRMKYYTGLTFREIGIALSISSNTAASRCRYALSKLRRIFER